MSRAQQMPAHLWVDVSKIKAKLVQYHQWADGRGPVLQGDRLLDPGLAVAAAGDAEDDLVLQEVHVLAGGDRQRAVADQVVSRVDQDQVALCSQGRQLFRAEQRETRQRPMTLTRLYAGRQAGLHWGRCQ